MSKSECSNRLKKLSKGSLAVFLAGLEGFERPRVMAEQYTTDSEIAAEVLWNISLMGDLPVYSGKVSVDLGCGTGILGIGMLLLGTKKVLFVDSDEKALEIAKKNLEKAKSEYSIGGGAVFLCKDINSFSERADLVVQNPPFGTKVRHMDKMFLKKAFESSDLVYSFHKNETKEFVKKFSTENGFEVTNIFNFDMKLKATFAHHTRRIKVIKISCFRIAKQKLFK